MILKYLSCNKRICRNLITLQLNVPKSTSSSNKKNVKLDVFAALKGVNLKEEVNHKKDVKTYENLKKTVRGAPFKDRPEGKETSAILNGLTLPKPLK